MIFHEARVEIQEGHTFVFRLQWLREQGCVKTKLYFLKTEWLHMKRIKPTHALLVYVKEAFQQAKETYLKGHACLVLPLPPILAKSYFPSIQIDLPDELDPACKSWLISYLTKEAYYADCVSIEIQRGVIQIRLNTGNIQEQKHAYLHGVADQSYFMTKKMKNGVFVFALA